MKAFAQSLQILISSPTKPKSSPKSPNTNGTKDSRRDGRRSKSNGGNGYSPISPVELGSPWISGSMSTDSGSTPTTTGGSPVAGGLRAGLIGAEVGRADGSALKDGSPRTDQGRDISSTSEILGSPIKKGDHLRVVDGLVDEQLGQVQYQGTSAVMGRLAPEGSFKSGTTIAEGSSNKENEVHAGRLMAATSETPVESGVSTGREGAVRSEIAGEDSGEASISQQGRCRTGRQPLAPISPPRVGSPLMVAENGDDADDQHRSDRGYADRTEKKATHGSALYDKEMTPKRSSTVGKSIKVEGRAGKRSIRDKFGLGSALRGKTLGKGYKARTSTANPLTETVHGAREAVPFPSDANTLHIPHRPPPLVRDSTFNRYPNQLSLVCPDVPTPICAWPTPKTSGEGTGEVDGRSSLGSGGTVKELQKGRVDESGRLDSIKPDESEAVLRLDSLLPTRTRPSDDPAYATVRSASRVEIRRVHSKRIKLQNLQIPGQGDTRGRVVSSTAIYDPGESGTTAKDAQDGPRAELQDSQTQLLSPLRIKTDRGSPETSPRSFSSSQPFREESRASAIFFTPPGTGPTLKTDIEDTRFIKGNKTIGRSGSKQEAAQLRRRSNSLPSDLIRELEDQNEMPHHIGPDFRSPMTSDSSTQPIIKVHFPNGQHAYDAGDLYSPPPRTSSKTVTADSPSGRPRDISFSSQPKIDLGDSLPDPYHSWPLLDAVPISVTASQNVETIADDVLRAMVAGMGVLSPMILSQFEFYILVEAAHRLKVVIDELSKKHGTEIRRRRRALLYLQENIARGETKQCQRVIKVISRMTETVDLDHQRLFIAQDQLRQVEALIAGHRERVLHAALSRDAKAQEGMSASLERYKRELQRLKLMASAAIPTPPADRVKNVSAQSPHLSTFISAPNAKRKTSVRFQPGPAVSYRSTVRRGGKRASIRSQIGERASTQSALSVDDWSIYKFPLPRLPNRR